MTALKRLIQFFLKSWPETALLSSALMLAIAHGFERIANLLPCTLCLKQREVYWVAIAIALAAIVIKRTRHARRVSPWLDGLLGLVFLFGAGLAFYHAGVEVVARTGDLRRRRRRGLDERDGATGERRQDRLSGLRQGPVALPRPLHGRLERHHLAQAGGMELRLGLQ